MDYKAINKYFLDLLYKEKPVYYGELDDKLLLSDSYAVFILEKDSVYLNLQKCKFVNEFAKKFIPDNSDYKYAYLTDTIELNKK